MTTQIQITTYTLGFLVENFFRKNLPNRQSSNASSCDYGFDRNEEELGQELSSSLPASISEPGIPDIDADDFDGLYTWFLA